MRLALGRTDAHELPLFEMTMIRSGVTNKRFCSQSRSGSASKSSAPQAETQPKHSKSQLLGPSRPQNQGCDVSHPINASRSSRTTPNATLTTSASSTKPVIGIQSEITSAGVKKYSTCLLYTSP